MAGAFDGNALIATKYGQMGPLLIGGKSLFEPRYWDRTNLHVIDHSVSYTPSGNQTPSFGDTARFVLQKRASLTGEMLIECVISAGVIGPANITAAYVKNLGDQLARTVTIRYGSHVLQAYPGEFQYIWHRVCQHDNHLEGRHALVLGGGGPGSPSEQDRINAVTQGVTVFIKLDEVFFSQYDDEHWMQEAYATEAEIEVEFEQLGRLVISGSLADPFAGGTRPAITQVRLRPMEVTLPAPEKAARLTHYESERGHLLKFLDIESQLNTTFAGLNTGANRELRVRLGNIRLDMVELFILFRDDFESANWSFDRLESDRNTASLILDPAAAPINGGDFATMHAIVSMRLEANGKRIFEDQAELLNRAWVRKYYHPDSQIADPIYVMSFARLPEDRKNSTSFQNAANLGQLELVLTVADWNPAGAAPGAPTSGRLNTANRRVDVYVHSHNLIQSRRGDAVKSLK